MISDANFEALRDLRQSVRALTVACVGFIGPSALIHEAFDRGVRSLPTRGQRELLRRIK